MTAKSPAETSAIQKLDDAEKDGCEAKFTAAEVKSLRRVVKMVQAFDVLGGLGRFIKGVLGWFVIVFAAWFALKNGVTEWVRGLQG